MTIATKFGLTVLESQMVYDTTVDWANMNILGTDAPHLHQANVYDGGYQLVYGATTATDAIACRVTGDSQNRITLDAGGAIWWSTGALAPDTTLYRSAVGVLRTDGAFSVGGAITLNGLSYTFPATRSDSQFLRHDTAGGLSWATVPVPTLETLAANETHVTATNYTVAADKSWVFCTAAVTITLPSGATTKREIKVVAVTGNSTVAAQAGSVIGGSADPVTGAVTNGSVRAGESFGYKSDGTNWRAV